MFGLSVSRKSRHDGWTFILLFLPLLLLLFKRPAPPCTLNNWMHITLSVVRVMQISQQLSLICVSILHEKQRVDFWKKHCYTFIYLNKIRRTTTNFRHWNTLAKGKMSTKIPIPKLGHAFSSVNIFFIFYITFIMTSINTCH